MRAILLLFFVVVFIGTGATEPAKSYSLERARHLEKSMLEAYKSRGLDGIKIYFNDKFRIRYYDDHIFNKTEFFKLLATVTYRAVFNDIKETYFDGDDLIVSYYEGQVQYDARLSPNRALLGGFEFMDIRPSY